MFIILSAIKHHFEKNPVSGKYIKCTSTIHVVLVVIIKSIFPGWVIDIYFIIIFVRFNNEGFILCYCILNYDDNHTFYLYVSDMLLLIIIFNCFKSVICCHFWYNCFESVKDLQKVILPNFDQHQHWKIHDSQYMKEVDTKHRIN